MSIRGLVQFSVASVAALAATIVSSNMTTAAEKISVAFNSFSPYGAWYIVKEKNLAKDIELDIKIIDGIPERTPRFLRGSSLA